MAKFVYKTAAITVAGTSLSDHCSSAAVEVTTDEVDLTAMGATYREFGTGLSTANITATFFNDFAAATVDAVLWPKSQDGSTFTVVVAPQGGTLSATQPSYTMTSRLLNYSPMGGGGIGDAATTDVTFSNASQAGITKGTSGTVL